MADIETPAVVLVRADNPGPFTLEGTNTWLVGRDPCWIVDPGPALAAHVEAVAAAAAEQGGCAGIVLTHDHDDHAGGIAELAARLGGDVPVFAVRAPAANERITDGDLIGPFEVLATPGHAPDHVAFRAGRALFSGDAVLGRGSVFVAPDPGALRGYLEALERLQAIELDAIHPGHGPLIDDPAAKLREYREHRLARERRLLEALDGGLRTIDDLLDAAWSEIPQQLRLAAAVTLAAHLGKLDDEGRLPGGVERPSGWS